MIVDPKGQHNDYFNKNGESLENKILFTLRHVASSIGRGGSLRHGLHVFALLDWTWQSRGARAFYVAHADEMGIGPAQPRDAQTRLDDFFATNPNGPMWQQRFNTFMQQQQDPN